MNNEYYMGPEYSNPYFQLMNRRVKPRSRSPSPMERVTPDEIPEPNETPARDKEVDEKELENRMIDIRVAKKLDWLNQKEMVPEHMMDGKNETPQINTIFELWTDPEVLICTEHYQANKQNASLAYSLAYKELIRKGFTARTKEQVEELMDNLWDTDYRVFTQELVNDIRELVAEHGKKWSIVGRFASVPPMRAQALYKALPKVQQCKPSWTRNEYIRFMKLRQEHGDQFYTISLEIPGRSAAACRKFAEDLKKTKEARIKKIAELEMKKRKEQGLPEAQYSEPWDVKDKALAAISTFAYDGRFDQMKKEQYPERTVDELYLAFFEEIGFQAHFDIRYTSHKKHNPANQS